jgi:lysine decarboxylase
VTGAAYAVDPVTRMSPRSAFFAAHRTVPLARAVGRVSVELVAPYPPGIPVLAPGEEVTEAVLHALGSARRAGVRIAYAADPSLETLRVVR